MAATLLLSMPLMAQVTSKPVVHWKFDEGSGTTTADATGNTTQLTFVPEMDETSWVAGKLGSALEFDGTVDKMTCPADSVYFDFGDRSFSISFWVKFEPENKTRKAFFYTTGTFLLGQTVLADTGVVKMQVKNKSGGKITIEVEEDLYFNGEWTLFTFVRDYENQTARIYANDQLAGERTYGDAFIVWDLADPDGLVHVGANSNPDPAKFFGTMGLMDDFRIYDTNLSQEDIAALYDGSADILGGYWPFDEESGMTASDLSGNMNDGTLFNMTDTNRVEGKLFGALQFDGASNYVKVPYDESLEFGDGPFSVSMWVKSAQRGYTGRYMSYGSLNFRQADADDVRFRINIDGAKFELIVPDATVVTDEWVLVTAVRDTAAGQLQIYSNTQLLGTLDVPAGNFDNTGDDKDLYIGSNNEAKIAEGKHQGLVGSIDEVRVFRGRALDVDDILELYSAGNTTYYDLTITDPEHGTITVVPSGGSYPEGTVVQLTAVADEGYHLESWGGDGSGSETVLNLTMDGDKTVTATFVEGELQFKLSITQDGDGTGFIARSTADTILDQGTEIVLTAVASEGSAFGGWTGDVESFETTVTFTMDKDMSVNATFVSSGPAYDVLVTYQELAATDTSGLNYTKDDPPSPLWTNNPGYLGDGFYDWTNVPGGTMEWTIKKADIDGAKKYYALVRYAHGGAGDRPAKIELNGVEIEASHSFQPTGAWSIWKKEAIEVDLLDADNTLKFTALSDDGMVNMDALEIARMPTSVPEWMLSSLEVYPNPATGRVFIGFQLEQGQGRVSVHIIDMTGRVVDEVANVDHHAGTYVFGYDTGTLADGMYFIRVRSRGQSVTRKLICR